MNIIEAIVKLKTDILDWATINFNNKLDKSTSSNNAGKFITVQENGDIGVDTFATVPVEKGGTGATDAKSAREALGAAPTYKYGTEVPTELEEGVLYFVYEVES